MREEGELRALTGIRGVAACLVVAYHYFTSSNSLGVGETFLKHGYIAVDLFFVLSGFVMSRTYGSTFRVGWSLRIYLEFIYKRLGRTYPLYFVLTMLAIFQAVAADQQLSKLQIASNLVLIQAWGTADSIVGPSWSISTEFMAYLLFPLLTAVILFGRRSWALVAFGIALAMVAFVATRTTEALNQIYDGNVYRNGPLDAFGRATIFPLLRCLAGFTLGLLAYRLSHVPAVWRLASWRYAADLLLLAAVVLMAVHGSDIVLLVLFVPLVISLASSQSTTARMLGRGLVYWLGLISYSIYLTHLLVLQVLEVPIRDMLSQAHFPHAFTFARVTTLLLTVLISAATFYLIEKPGRDWSRRLLGFRRPRSIETEPAPP